MSRSWRLHPPGARAGQEPAAVALGKLGGAEGGRARWSGAWAQAAARSNGQTLGELCEDLEMTRQTAALEAEEMAKLEGAA
jgi:hypothetical protein